MASPTEIRKGRVMDYQGAPHLVLDMQHRTQGRQAGFVQVTLRNMNTGASTTNKFRTTETVEFMHTEQRKLEYSYKDADGYHFMDPDTYDDIIFDEAMVSEALDFMVEGKEYDITYVDDKPTSISLPASIEVKVVESPEGVRGDTASNVQKPATLETGLVVQVPLFIKEGEIIKINTESKAYVSRA